MKRLIILLIATTIAVPSAASINRCNVNGKIVFTDQPCQDGVGLNYIEETDKSDSAANTETQPQYRSGTTSRGTRAWPDQRPVSQKKQPSISSLEAAYFILDDEVGRLEEKVRKLRSRQTAEVNLLRQKKSRANNNLAGATWLNSISKEMAAVVSLYNNRIRTAQADVDRKKKDRRIAKDKIRARKKVGY